MFDKFGEMGSYKEINELADNLFNEGDIESLKEMAKENGIDEDMVMLFINGDTPLLCDPMTAALGKLELEEKDMKPKEIMADWVEYIKCQVAEDYQLAEAVRKTGKSLRGCIAKILNWSFKNQIPIETEILKEAGVNASRVTLGIPGMGKAKKLIRTYYMEG